MELLQKHKENLIVQRALTLFLYNFNTYPEIIEEMKAENKGFKNAWENLQAESKQRWKKNGGMWIIEFTEIYALFATKLTYEAQALLIEKVIKTYGKNAKNDIEFSIKINAVREGRKNKSHQ